MRNNKACQLCGVEIEGSPRFTEATLDLPLCSKCFSRVTMFMGKCRKGGCFIAVDALIVQMSRKSPILLLSKRGGQRKSTWIVWPDRRKPKI